MSFVKKDSHCYNGNENLKKAGVKVPMNVFEREEYLKCMDNVEYFVEKYCQIVSLDEGLVYFNLFPYQRNMLKHVSENRFSIMMLPRQMGKCFSKLNSVIIRNKLTGEVRDITIGDFYTMQGGDVEAEFDEGQDHFIEAIPRRDSILHAEIEKIYGDWSPRPRPRKR